MDWARRRGAGQPAGQRQTRPRSQIRGRPNSDSPPRRRSRLCAGSTPQPRRVLLPPRPSRGSCHYQPRGMPRKAACRSDPAIVGLHAVSDSGISVSRVECHPGEHSWVTAWDRPVEAKVGDVLETGRPRIPGRNPRRHRSGNRAARLKIAAGSIAAAVLQVADRHEPFRLVLHPTLHGRTELRRALVIEFAEVFTALSSARTQS